MATTPGPGCEERKRSGFAGGLASGRGLGVGLDAVLGDVQAGHRFLFADADAHAEFQQEEQGETGDQRPGGYRYYADDLRG